MDELSPQVQSPAGAYHEHEDSDVSIRALAAFLICLAVTLAVVGALMVWLFDYFLAEAKQADLSPSPLAASAPSTPTPLLQLTERSELRQLRQREEHLLGKTEWVDRERGIARIPIDRAIERAARQGLPRWPAVQGDSQP